MLKCLKRLIFFARVPEPGDPAARTRVPPRGRRHTVELAAVRAFLQLNHAPSFALE
jgi:hypothetical protein